MRRSSESPGSGSARKRQRLSSPTYEEQFPITQDDMETFDELEKQLSQAVPAALPHSRSLPSEDSKASGVNRLDDEVLGAEYDGKDRENGTSGQGLSSPPVANLSATQERAAEDSFFSAGLGGGGGFASAASLSSKSRHSLPSGSTSLAGLPLARPRSSSDITSAAKLLDASTSLREHDDVSPEDDPPSMLAKFGGFGRASVLPTRPEDPYAHDRSPSPSDLPRQPNYDSWFDSDASALPPDAFAFKTARTIMDPARAGDIPASQSSQPSGFTSGLQQWKSASQLGNETSPTDADVLPSVSVSGFSSAAHAGFGSAANVGFSSVASLNGGKSNWAAPSVESLARAAERMKQWHTEYAQEESMLSSSNDDIENAPAGPSSVAPPLPISQPFRTPLRPALRPMENSRTSPARLPDTPLASKNPTHYTNIGGGVQMKNKQFKSPLITRPARVVSAPAAHRGSPLNPGTRAESRTASGSKLPAAFAFVDTSALPAAVPVTPARPGPSTHLTSPGKGKSLGMTPRRVAGLSSVGKGKGKFTTPFKPGMAPGEPGRMQLEQDRIKEDVQTHTPLRVAVARTGSAKGKTRKEYRFFDLNPRPDRKTLAASGLRPQSYTQEELEDMGINVEELWQMSPSNAIYYKFHSSLPTTDLEDPPEPSQLGPEEALAKLKELGCTLATQAWVTNHYGLILWKLAGMVCLEPEREQVPETKRWCWPEVIRQLLYRYERELNGGSRPALRLICTEDAPASCPMVLCVSNIFWSPAVVDGSGVPLDPHPELEVTDGWYRLRARVDLPLARATRRRLICVGTKLAVSGAKLSGDRKEACEILDAYDNTELVLSSNSAHLAPWHAKLGFVKEPFIATLDSLSPDGGTVPAMDLVVVKAYPVAYLEFAPNEDGTVTRVGPRNEKEELKAHDQWLTLRENEIAKIRASLEKQIHLLETMADRLYDIAGPRFQGRYKADEPIPDHIENLYSELVEEEPRPSPSQLSGRLNYMDAGWLHAHTQHQIKLAKERMHEDIERELQYACPPRSVRDFRVVSVRDARWQRKEPMRTAQITLWDPMRMVFSEGGSPGDIREGQRFLVTNLQPNQLNAWMSPGPDSVIYLVSKKNARWTNIKTKRC